LTRRETLVNPRVTPVPAKASLLIISFAPLFLAVGFIQIVLGAWLVTVGFTAVQAGALISAQGIATILASVPLGLLSDAYGRKYILTLGALAGAAALFAFSLTMDFRVLLGISAILGFGEGASLATWNALLADMTDESNRNRVFSLSFVMINVATGVGLVLPGAFPGLGTALGLTNYAIHKETLMLLGGASFLTPVALFVLLRSHREAFEPGRRWAGLRNKATLFKLGFTSTTIGFGAGFIIPLVGAWFFYRFDVGDDLSGPILAFSNILIGFSALAAPRLAARFGQQRAILLTTGSSMLFMLSMAFIPAFSVAAGVYVVRSALMNMSGPLMDSFSMGIFPAEQRGLVSALSNVMFRLPNSFGTYLGGFILGLGLLQLPFFIASALYTVGLSGFYFFFARRSSRWASVAERTGANA
jgi:MFS family permease